MVLALTLTLGSRCCGPVAAAPVVYERTAFVSSGGDDGTAEINNASLPYETLDAAIADLNTEYPTGELTVRLLDDVTDDATLDPAVYDGRVTFKGHGGVRALFGTITIDGANGANGANGDPPTVGEDGENAGGVTLDAVALGNISAVGGNGGNGGDFSGTDGDGADGGDAGNGGNVTLLNGASIETVSPNAGTVGAGGAGGSNSGDPGADGAAGGHGYLLNHQGFEILTDENWQPLTDQNGNYLTTGAPPA